MTEGPISKPPGNDSNTTLFFNYPLYENELDQFKKAIKRAPRKGLHFITVKDNAQKTKWTKIGKVNDWLRKVSECYFVVKGTAGGPHFHALMSLKKGKVIRYQKGIHMHVRPIVERNVFAPTREEAKEMKDNKEYAEYIREMKTELYSKPECAKIAAMIRKYWTRNISRGKRAARKLKNEDEISRIIRYMEKNLSEPRPHTLRRYHDWLTKC